MYIQSLTIYALFQSVPFVEEYYNKAGVILRARPLVQDRSYTVKVPWK